MARVVRVVSLVIAAAGLLWTLRLALLGGFDSVILGRRVTSNEPLRPLALAVVALTAFVLASGANRTAARWIAVGRAVNPHWIAGTLAVLTFVAGCWFGVAAATAESPYAVVSEADLWLSGHLKQTQPWVADVPWPSREWSFTPLGYGPVANDEPWTIVPASAAAGLPILMAIAKRVGGQCAIAFVVPLFGSLTILAAYLVGRRVGSSLMGVMAAWLIATSPVFLAGLMLPLPGVAATGALGLAVWFLSGSRLRSAAAAGASLAVAILIRPVLAPLAAVMALWFFLRRPRDRDVTWGRRLRDASVFLVSTTPGVFVAAVIAQYLYGSTTRPLEPGLLDAFSWSNPLPWPWLALGASGVAALLVKRAAPPLSLAVAGAVFLIGAYDLRLAVRTGAFDLARRHAESVAVARDVRDETEPGSVIFSLVHSGSLRYYAGRVTLRWDLLDRGWLDRAVAWLNDRGVQAYAVLDDEEVAAFKERFSDQSPTRWLDRPRAIYQGVARTRFYAFTPPASGAPASPTIVDSSGGSARCAPPAPAPHLVFAR